jgi:hypothetical protein
MYDAGKIITGLIVFVILFTSPFWLNLSGNPGYSPDVKYPAGVSECIAGKEYMNHNHMEILNDWRNKVVRSDLRYYKKNGRTFLIDGKPAEMSLTHSCLKCHNDKKAFCDRCHDYLAVKPYCWDCHVVPGEVKK